MQIGPIPPWLQQSADPAQHYARGLAIGAELGAQRARQQMAAHQSELEATRMAIGDARAREEMAMRAEQIALQRKEAERQFAAQDEYQKLVASGMDPMQALLKVGPTIGQGAAAFAAAHKEFMPAPEPREVTLGLGDGRTVTGLQNVRTGNVDFAPAPLYRRNSEMPVPAPLKDTEGNATGYWGYADEQGDWHVLPQYPRPPAEGNLTEQENALRQDLHRRQNVIENNFLFSQWQLQGGKKSGPTYERLKPLIDEWEAIRTQLAEFYPGSRVESPAVPSQTRTNNITIRKVR